MAPRAGRIACVTRASRGNGRLPVQQREINGDPCLAQDQTRIKYGKERRKREEYEPLSNAVSWSPRTTGPRERPTRPAARCRRFPADLEAKPLR